MSHKTWTFTTFEGGKPVATEYNVNRDEALAAIRAAMTGAPVGEALERDHEVVELAEPAELAHAA